MPDLQEQTHLCLDVTRIKAYERNPRRSKNPEYERIQASIRERGLEQPLVITRRPDESEFMVCAGGNTRLRILRQLCDRTGEERFCRVHCLYRPWTKESDVLLAHLRENDLRGGLSLVDRARAVVEARSLLGEELGEPISLRRLAAELRGAGYHISHSRISQMEYAVRTLLPRIPQALESGLGWRQVSRMRALERAAKMLWERYCLDGAGGFDDVFWQLCRRYDGPDWDIGPAHGGPGKRESRRRPATSSRMCALVLDAAMEGREEALPAPEPDPCAPPEAGTAPVAVSPGREVPAMPQADAVRPVPLRPGTPPAPSSARPWTGIRPMNWPPMRSRPGMSAFNLKALRGRAFTLADCLARRCGLDELVLPLPDHGLGFILRDVPDPRAGPDAAGPPQQVHTLWWQLAACSEVTVAPPEQIVPRLPADLPAAQGPRDAQPRLAAGAGARIRSRAHRLRAVVHAARTGLERPGPSSGQLPAHPPGSGRGRHPALGKHAMKASKEVDLVVAVLQYAARCLKEGDLAALRDMKFGAREIEGLSSIYILDMYHMEGLRMHCLDIKLNPVVYWPLIESLRRMRESEDDIHRLIVQDAPREMLRALFGLNPREYSRLRRTLTMTPAVGRPRGADEESSPAPVGGPAGAW